MRKNNENITTLEHLITCAEYLIETEKEDYFEYCKNENLDHKNLKNNHIYTSAIQALNLKIED